jgi:putative nucleotidyltransferase with HDIG domain
VACTLFGLESPLGLRRDPEFRPLGPPGDVSRLAGTDTAAPVTVQVAAPPGAVLTEGGVVSGIASGGSTSYRGIPFAAPAAGALEGWIRALDLRDGETQGHSRRVVDLSVRLAEELGVCSEQLVHVRRGALLHDVGKMAQPDTVLLKAGELDEEEQALMRRHPGHAWEMLRGIDFLRPALDIPYCHHERWTEPATREA